MMCQVQAAAAAGSMTIDAPPFVPAALQTGPLSAVFGAVFARTKNAFASVFVCVHLVV